MSASKIDQAKKLVVLSAAHTGPIKFEWKQVWEQEEQIMSYTGRVVLTLYGGRKSLSGSVVRHEEMVVVDFQ